jgi:hypothetical protein
MTTGRRSSTKRTRKNSNTTRTDYMEYDSEDSNFTENRIKSCIRQELNELFAKETLKRDKEIKTF